MSCPGAALRGSAAILVLGLAALVAAPIRAEGLTLVAGGRAQLPLVLATGAIPAERTAARELAGYLERISGAEFSIVEESEHPPGAPAIHIGPSAAARRAGIVSRSMDPEAWILRTVEHGLLVTGGRPRGSLYAAYHLLEDHLGVRWWTPFEEFVPHRSSVDLPQIDRAGQPAFHYRDVHGVIGPAEFRARSRINGQFSELGPEYGDSIRYGPPYFVHTFDWYVPPAEVFAEHPEFYSQIDGKRQAGIGQLCLTQPALLRWFEERLRENIARGRAEAEALGLPAPRYYDVSPNDRLGHCECEACSRIAQREQSDSGALLEFVNALADGVAGYAPEVVLTTLAYLRTYRAPLHLEPRDNVIVRYSSLQYRDFSRPLTHAANRDPRIQLENWLAIAPELWVWGYAVTFGPAAGFPLPNLGVLATDLRYYFDSGVRGMFVQHDHPIVSDLRDLKLYLLARLLEDPYRSRQQLIEEFTDGYYGPAGGAVREYLRLLEQAALSKPSRIVYSAEPAQFRYLDRRLIRRAHRLFERAEQTVASDPIRLRRVRHARMSLDRATLAGWRRYRPRWKPWRWFAGSPRQTWKQVAERLQHTWEEQIDLRLPESQRPAARQQGRSDVRKWVKRL